MRVRPTPFRPAGLLAGALVAALAFALASCEGDRGDPPPGTRPSTLAFVLDGSATVSFQGEGAWPPSGTGVIARTDSARTTLQIAAYRQVSGKAGASGPEPRFDVLFLQVDQPGGLTAGLHLPTIALFGEDLALHEVDSLAYFGVSGSFNLGMITADRAAGTFSGIAMRGTDSAVVSIGAGSFDAALATGVLSFDDTGSAAGTIAVSVGTGTAPVYSWTGGPVYALGVARASAPNSLVWGIVTAGGDSVLTGVTHGTVPAGAMLVTNTEPVLTPGVAYRVTVSRTAGTFGTKDFVP